MKPFLPEPVVKPWLILHSQSFTVCFFNHLITVLVHGSSHGQILNSDYELIEVRAFPL